MKIINIHIIPTVTTNITTILNTITIITIIIVNGTIIITTSITKNILVSHIKNPLLFSAIIPAPLVNIRSANKSIVVSVTPPPNVDVKGYKLTYRFFNDKHDKLGEKIEVITHKKAFDYHLEGIGLYI
jgi:hypothetical protein